MPDGIAPGEFEHRGQWSVFGFLWHRLSSLCPCTGRI
jgi:hypothetical protein